MTTEKNNKSENPGKAFLQTGVSIGGLNKQIIGIGGQLALNPTLVLTPQLDRIMYHIDVATKNSIEHHEGSQQISLAIARMREAGILLSAGIPEDDYRWDIFHNNIRMTLAENMEVTKMMDARLNGEDEKDSMEAYQYLGAAGILMTELMIRHNPELQKQYEEKIKQITPSIKAAVLIEKLERDLQPIKMAADFANMLQEQGIVFNKEGDIVHTEKYYELLKAGKIQGHEHNRTSTPTAVHDTNTGRAGSESQSGTIPGSSADLS